MGIAWISSVLGIVGMREEANYNTSLNMSFHAFFINSIKWDFRV